MENAWSKRQDFSGELVLKRMPIRAKGNVGQISALQRRWVLTLLTFASFLWAMNALLAENWGALTRWIWTLAAGAFCAYVLTVLWKALPYNYRLEDGVFFSSFGAGNLLSLLRGWFLGAMAGFILTPLPSGWLAWLPGMLYILNGVADFFDGYLARRSHQVTAMGERLDLSLDGLGVLFASLLLYRYGTLPFWILLVGAARFIFLFVTWLRKKSGRAVYDLPPSPLRRALAGAQMGFLGAALLPVFKPPATIWAGAFFSFPFLLNFGRDLLWMCGIRFDNLVSSGVTRMIEGFSGVVKRCLMDWLPLGLRLLIGVALGQALWDWFSTSPSFLTDWTPLGSAQTQFQLMRLFYLFGTVSTVLGLVGRGGAALLLIGVGLQQGILPLGWLGKSILIAGCLLLFSGSGKVALWKPEERLIRHRWGERPDA
jgi:CDP-diacylglycerol--glycerol-3-phosphate 3-phosphatidyltransferase